MCTSFDINFHKERDILLKNLVFDPFRWVIMVYLFNNKFKDLHFYMYLEGLTHLNNLFQTKVPISAVLFLIPLFLF